MKKHSYIVARCLLGIAKLRSSRFALALFHSSTRARFLVRQLLGSKKLASFVVAGIFISSETFAQQPSKSQEGMSQDPLVWLNMIARSVKEADFTGIYIHQYGHKVDTARITHLSDESGEQEKLETLDGLSREIIRKNEEVTCYIPEAKLVRIDRKKDRKFFPGLISNVSSILENYIAKLGGVDRVAGFDCQQILLNPKDNLRFAHRFCAELNSGLLLRATMLTDKSEIIEQFVFTQISLATPTTPIHPDQLKPTYSTKNTGWQVEKAPFNDSKPDSGWYVKSLPPGFKKLTEVKRTMSGKTDPVVQQIYSDGLASVSVFIESGTDKQSGMIQQGSYTIFVRPLQESKPFTVKVLGEVPNVSLQRIGNSVADKSVSP